MDNTEKLKTKNKSIMVLGTSSGVGKSITVTAICRILKDLDEKPFPFKGQNMSNNAWVDLEGGEMAFSQAIQAFASGRIPTSEMNPILLKPQGDSISEVIHLGKSVGITTARNYYQNWFKSGWETIKKGLSNILEKNDNCRLIIEGAGSPVEMNLIHRDLTNLRIARYLEANCILVADIERGGVFAQIIGTLELLKPEEKKLIKGIIINRFRGDISLFDEGKKWIEKKTRIPILGILPCLKENFPPEDSLDLLDRKSVNKNPELEVGIIKFPSISNFSDLDPLDNEEGIQLNWIKNYQNLDKFDLIILPGSKQTIKDITFLTETGLIKCILEYSKKNGNILGICGGLQMLGEYLEDPYSKEGLITSKKESIRGIGLLPLKTIFKKTKITKRIVCEATWPCTTKVEGFEIHNGVTELIKRRGEKNFKNMFKQKKLGWFIDNNERGSIAGSYLHGIFDNDKWRINYLNLIRIKKGIQILDKQNKPYKIKREAIINNLADQFKKHINIESLLN